jgi:hypothetical protein
MDAGASYTLDAAAVGLERPWNFYGGVSLNRQVKRSRVTAFYRREVIPVFGFGGLRLTDRVGLSASIPLGRNLSFGLSGTYVADRPTEGGTASFESGDTGLSLAWRIARHLSLSAEGRYRRRSATGSLGELDDFAGGLFLSLVPARGSSAR